MKRVPKDSGFSLLEVLISIAILAMGLVVLFSITTNNIVATEHARMTSIATFLARTKIADIEDKVLEEGFDISDEEEDGTFEDVGFPEYRWVSTVERIELPTNMLDQTQDMAGDMIDSDNPMDNMQGMMGSMLGGFIEPIRIGLEESLRRVNVRVLWDEPGRPERFFDVVLFLTDPSKLDLAVQFAAGGGEGEAGTSEANANATGTSPSTAGSNTRSNSSSNARTGTPTGGAPR